MTEPRIFGEPAPERADAARNRGRILAAAEALFAERGVAGVSMDDVAEAAGVGKGTIYRRFGDKAGLGIAVLDARERDLQDAILRGPPPLGPGARPAERLHAFADTYLDYLDRNLDLVVMSETAAPGARYRTGVYAGWHWHVEHVLTAAGRSHPSVLADCLLGVLGGELHWHLRRSGTSPDFRAALHQLIDDVMHARAQA
ncbi:MAG: TetR/AcrR family transcriptional regulator [Chloroflexota bacterium]|nr:TetR/AcrR family transcriptional regulator [Chloroflexota bacterium]